MSTTTKIFSLDLGSSIEALPETDLPFVRHSIAEATGITAGEIDGDILVENMDKLCQGLELHVVSRHTHQFEPHGMSVIYVLEESHLAIHTWPEKGYVHMDLVTCSAEDYGDGNLSRLVEEIFKPGMVRVIRLKY